MEEDRRGPLWGFADGSLSVSGSMLLSVLINYCQSCNGVWLLGFLKELSDKNDGLIVVATLLLFPVAAVIYGGVHLFFAAKEAFERRQRKLREAAREAGFEEGHQEGQQQGRQEGRQEERRRIGRALEERGIAITPDIARILDDESAPRS